MEKKGFIKWFKSWYRKLPDKKRYLEFLSAMLTIPVLLTIILINLGSLKNKSNENLTPTPAPTAVVRPQGAITVILAPTDKDASPTPTSTPQCKQEVGPVEIVTPQEGQTATQSPVCFTISYKDNSYCSVVWAYKIDGGSLSDYTDKSVCIYNLSQGSHRFELMVKSVVSSDSTSLVRNFIYQGPVPTQLPSPTPSLTPSQ